MRNIKRNGDLVEYKNLRKFKQKGDPIWVLCKLRVFRSGGGFFPAFECSICPEMAGLQDLALDQIEHQIKASLCIHSKMAQIVVDRQGFWGAVLPLNLGQIPVATMC